MAPSRCARRAVELVALGYVSVTARLSWDATTCKKCVSYKPCWQKATLNNCLAEFVENSHNALAIVTGEPSDCIVLDVDHLKEAEVGRVADGALIINNMVAAHGMPPNTPVARTGSGGKHYYFSLSSSMNHGLINTQNRSKVLVDGAPTTIDIRADGGNVLVEPTTYLAGADRRTYVFTHPLCPCEELPPMPAWLIDLLNVDKGDGGGGTSASQLCPRRWGPTEGGETRKRSREVCGADGGGSTFLRRVRPALEKHLSNTIERCYPRPEGFDFSLADKTKLCVLCGNVHTSNNFRCRQVLTDCFTLSNYSAKCRSTHVFDYEKHPIVRRIIEAPCTDNAYCLMLQAVENYDGREIRVTGDKKLFYEFNGDHWANVDETSVQRHLRLLAFNSLDMLTASLAAKQQHNKDHKVEDAELSRHLKQLNAGKAFVQRAGNIAAITTSAKQLWWDPTLSRLLDTERDLLGVPGGVVDLRTGDLRRGKREDHVSRVIETEYRGLHHPTPDVDAFMWSLFENAEVVAYLQQVLGYGITGHVKDQKWLICHGAGSNGKGVLQRCLQRLLGDYFGPMSADCIIKRGRPAGKNAPTPYLADLAGKRIVVCDELPEGATLDDELVKRATGDSTIEARYLHSNPILFEPTHLGILLTNHKPKLNIDDEGMLRRLIFLPFDLRFKHPHELDADDPTHRPLDPNAAAKLTTPECQEQLLTWLVRGAVAWVAAGSLPPPPAKMQAALASYVDENDDLAQFIREHCTVGDEYKVETKTFLQAFAQVTSKTLTTQLLAKKMDARGFSKKRAACSVPGRPYYFDKIKLNSD